MNRMTSYAALLAMCVCSFATADQPSESPDSAAKYVCPPCGDGACDKLKHDAAGTCPTCGMTLVEVGRDKILNVAIVIHDGVELLDFAGPGEVFAAASLHNGSSGITFNVYTVAPSAKNVVSQGFLDIRPRFSIDNCPEPDILVIPGGRTGVLVNDEKFMAWAKGITAKAMTTLTVCTGAFVVGTNGQLDGLKATTHHGAISSLRDSFPKVTVYQNQRFVDNGRIITTAGVSAGIDGALHVVAKIMGFSAAKDTAVYMEYEWTTEQLTRTAVAEQQHTEATRSEQRDKAFEASYTHIKDQDWPTAAEAFNKLAGRFPDDAEVWYYVGLTHHNTQKWDRAVEAHQRSASLPGYHRERPLYNLACSYALMGNSEAALDSLESAIEAGWDDKTRTRTDADLESLRELPRFNELVELLKDSAAR